MFESKVCASADAVLIIHILIVFVVVIGPFCLPGWTLRYQLCFPPLIIILGTLFGGCFVTLFEHYLRELSGGACSVDPVSEKIDLCVDDFESLNAAPNSHGSGRSHAIMDRIFFTVFRRPLDDDMFLICSMGWWFVIFVIFLRAEHSPLFCCGHKHPI